MNMPLSEKQREVPNEAQRIVLLDYELGILNIKRLQQGQGKIDLKTNENILDNTQAMKEIVFNLGYTYYLWASDSLKNNSQWVATLVEHRPEMYPILTEEMKNQPEIALHALQKYENLQYLPVSLLSHKRVALQAVKKDMYHYLKLNEVLKHDADVIVQILRQDEANVADIPLNVFNNKQLLMKIYQKGGAIPLEKVDKHILDDEIVLAALNVDIDNILVAPAHIQQDEKWISLSVYHDFNYLRLFPEQSKNKNFILNHLTDNIRGLDFVSKELLDDNDIADKALSLNPYLYRYLSNRLKYEKKYIDLTLRNNLENLQYLPEEIKSDKTFILNVIKEHKQSGQYFRHLKKYFADDDEVTTAILDLDVFAYENFSPRLKEKPENITKVLSNVGTFLKKMPKEVRENWKYVCIAINSQPDAINEAAPRYKKDIKIALRLIKKDPFALAFMNPILWENNSLLIYALKVEPDLRKHILPEIWEQRMPIDEPSPSRFIKSWLLHEKLNNEIMLMEDEHDNEKKSKQTIKVSLNKI